MVPSFKPKTNENIKNKLSRPKNEQVVLDYFKKEEWPAIEGKKFYYYYEAIGWKISGKIPLVDWQASAQSWIIKSEEMKKGASGVAHGQFLDNLKTTKYKDYNQPL